MMPESADGQLHGRKADGSLRRCAEGKVTFVAMTVILYLLGCNPHVSHHRETDEIRPPKINHWSQAIQAPGAKTTLKGSLSDGKLVNLPEGIRAVLRTTHAQLYLHANGDASLHVEDIAPVPILSGQQAKLAVVEMVKPREAHEELFHTILFEQQILAVQCNWIPNAVAAALRQDPSAVTREKLVRISQEWLEAGSLGFDGDSRILGSVQLTAALNERGRRLLQETIDSGKGNSPALSQPSPSSAHVR